MHNPDSPSAVPNACTPLPYLAGLTTTPRRCSNERAPSGARAGMPAAALLRSRPASPSADNDSHR